MKNRNQITIRIDSLSIYLEGEKLLTKWETLFLLLLTIPIMGHVVILPILLDVAGKDAWISILLTLPAAFMFAFGIYWLRKHYPNSGVSEILTTLLGKWTGSVVKVILIFYFTFLMILSLATLVDLIYIVFLPNTPRWAILGWFWIFFIYAAIKGIKKIALTAGILTFITMITGHTVTLLDSGKKDWNYMLPVLEFGWSPVLLGSLIILSIWMELLLLLCVPIQNIREKRLFLIWVIGILLNILMMLSTTTGVVTIFSIGQAENFVYPATEIVRIISLGIIDRFDIYALVLMTFGTYVRCSLFFRISYDICMYQAKSILLKRITFLLFSLVSFIGALYLANDHFRIDGAIVVYTYMLFLFPFPFLLLWIRRRKVGRERRLRV